MANKSLQCLKRQICYIQKSRKKNKISMESKIKNCLIQAHIKNISLAFMAIN